MSMRIALVGPSGSGKSTLADKFAKAYPAAQRFGELTPATIKALPADCDVIVEASEPYRHLIPGDFEIVPARVVMPLLHDVAAVEAAR